MVLAVLWTGSSPLLAASAPIRYNRDIRPIFSDNCFSCHGPDKNKRKAKLRLDTRDGLFAAIDNVYPVVPGKPEESDVFRRITTHDPDDLMPKSKTGAALTPRQIDLIKRWILQGAKWEGFWAYTPPVRPPSPQVKHSKWPLNPVDDFILARLQAEKLKPSADADKRTLLRRLNFDLTGLPPTLEEVEAFAADNSPRAYENAVDRLLASPHYGERMAEMWLDEVRYADTDGFHADNYRSVYPYRDYVIRAFNDDMRFDRFTREQIGGDLLPNRTQDQLIASTYNRLGRSTEEGGAQPKEYLAKYAADRVRATSETWLASTMGCCECHDHKFDPFLTRDFYSFEAFFADVKEQGVGVRQGVPLPSPKQAAEEKALAAKEAALQKTLDTSTPALKAAQAKWEKSLAPPELALDVWFSCGPFVAKSFDAAYETAFDPETNADRGGAYSPGNLKWTLRTNFTDGMVHNGLQGSNSATYLYRTVYAASGRPLKLFLGSDDAIKAWLNGTNILHHDIERGAEADQEQVAVHLQPGENELVLKIVNGAADSGFYFQAGAASNAAVLLKIPARPAHGRTKSRAVKIFSIHRPAIGCRAGRIGVHQDETLGLAKDHPHHAGHGSRRTACHAGLAARQLDGRHGRNRFARRSGLSQSRRQPAPIA